MDNADALTKFHVLLLALARLVTSIVLSRGPQNQQSIVQARSFLVENRSLVVAMFKRSAKIGGQVGGGTMTTTTTTTTRVTTAAATGEATTESIVEELVGLFVLLMTFTGFVEYEEEMDARGSRKKGFT